MVSSPPVPFICVSLTGRSGEIIAYAPRVEPRRTMTHPPQSTTLPLATAPPPGTQLYVRDTEGRFQPYMHGNTATQATRHQQSSTKPAGNAAALASQPIQRSIGSGTPIEWDGWPNGDWERDYSWEEVHATKHLQVHWATKTIGGDRKGDELALSWENGKRSTRRCLGIIDCDNGSCKRIIRPQTTSQGIAKQLSHQCECGAVLSHTVCTVVSVLMTWSGGIHYANGGHHEHPRPTYLLHVSRDEEATFQSLVQGNPTTGPLGLIVGPRGLHGPGPSVADISPVYLNIDRVANDRRKLKKGTAITADNFIQEFAQFTAAHPEFVVHEQLGEITVICMQSTFMMNQAIQDHRLDEPVNGIVSDAAHGWWRNRTSLLIISSIYSSVLRCWVPMPFPVPLCDRFRFWALAGCHVT